MAQLIYLHGPVFWQNKTQLKEFALAKKELENLGFKVMTALDNYPDEMDFADGDARQLYLTQRRLDMFTCQTIVTLDAFEYDHYTIADIKEARAQGRMVRKVVSFIEAYKNNAAPASATAEKTKTL